MRVVDGDTIVVDMEGQRYRVRYIGIDTPETHHPSDGANYLGYEATDANLDWVGEGTTVVLQRDISETDQYDRLLRYVWVGDTLANAELVRQGLARVRFYEPDVLYQAEIEAALDEARKADIGLHGPRPTRPTEPPLVRTGKAWTVAPKGEAVDLYLGAARGNPERAFPAGLEVRVVDAFWVPEQQEWWYWIGVNGFNGWTTGEHIQRVEPAETVPGPQEPWEAYDWFETVEVVTVHGQPGGIAESVTEWAAGTPVQVKGLSWDEHESEWWYFVESPEGEGWVRPEGLERQ